MTTEDSAPPSIRNGYSDDTIKGLIDDEKKIIEAYRTRTADDEWTGIGLSGGGIRAATFCLGALQAMASKNVLGRFDYISSVSGGGYTSAALQWHWANGPTLGTSSKNFPYGSELLAESPNANGELLLSFLRGHARYLTPGAGLTVWALPAVVFRTVFLNLFIWIPLGAAAFILLFALGRIIAEIAPFLAHGSHYDFLQGLLKTGPHVIFNLLGQLIALLAGLSAVFALLLLVFSSIVPPESTTTPATLRRRIVTTMVVAFAFLIPAGIGIAVSAIGDKMGAGSAFFVWLAPPLLIGFALIIGFQIFGDVAFNEQYRARRLSEIYGGLALAVIACLCMLAAIPLVTSLIASTPASKSAVAIFSTISSVVTGVYGHLTRGTGTERTVSSYISTALAGLFLYSAAMLAYFLANWIVPDDQWATFATAIKDDRPQVVGVFWIGLAFLFALTTNINYLGLYRFYRDRLMEAFMPSPQSLAKWNTEFSAADRYSITDLWPQYQPANAAPQSPAHNAVQTPPTNIDRPYPIFNTNAVLVRDPDPKLTERGGDNFILSPLYVGSTATGWQNTLAYIKAHSSPVTLPTAMAASGAAVNSNAAYIGEGFTRDRLVSIAMMLMNIRLGWWFARPNSGAGKPNHIYPGFSSGVLGRGYKSDSRFVELSDGGNFDNLGLYELVRRRLKIIFIIDGEEDDASAMPALVSVTQRIHEDFGVRIDLDRRVDNLMPAAATGFPPKVDFAAKAYFTARINYPGEAPGILVYVKARLIAQLGFVVRGFRAKNASFPNEPTFNQFFEPEQFEAYRTLGYVCMTSALDDLRLKGGLPTSANLLTSCKLDAP